MMNLNGNGSVDDLVFSAPGVLPSSPLPPVKPVNPLSPTRKELRDELEFFARTTLSDLIRRELASLSASLRPTAQNMRQSISPMMDKRHSIGSHMDINSRYGSVSTVHDMPPSHLPGHGHGHRSSIAQMDHALAKEVHKHHVAELQAQESFTKIDSEDDHAFSLRGRKGFLVHDVVEHMQHPHAHFARGMTDDIDAKPKKLMRQRTKAELKTYKKQVTKIISEAEITNRVSTASRVSVTSKTWEDATVEYRARSRSLKSISGSRMKTMDTDASVEEEENEPQADQGFDHRQKGRTAGALRAPSMWAWWRFRTRVIVQSNTFGYCVGFLIMANALSIGIQTEYAAGHVNKELPHGFTVIEYLFCVVFTVELAIRMFAYGVDFFFVPTWRWNIFDSFVVGMQLIELATASLFEGESATGDQNISFIRIIRVLRLVRIVRLVRVLRLIRELHTIICSIVGSMKSLAWTVIFICFVIYIIGVFLCQIVVDFRNGNPEETTVHLELHKFYGNLTRSFFTLFLAISGGLSWNECVWPLVEGIGAWMALAFSLYIAFAVLALLNVVTGVFVDSAMTSTKHDEDMEMVQRLRDVFEQTDVDGSGIITWEEFEDALQEPEMEKTFEALDLDLSEARSLFKLLDLDENGTVEAEEFVMGIFRLRGTAKAIELGTLMFENSRWQRRWKEHAHHVEQKLNVIIEAVELLQLDPKLDE